MMKHSYLYISLFSLLVAACSDDTMRGVYPDDNNSTGKIRLQAEIDQVNVTRADDSGFADGDVIGVYAVDFVGGQPGKLESTGNNADNVDFTFDESSYSWRGSKSLVFTDDKTPVDIYGYYPYSKEINNVEAYTISVEANQSGDSKTMKMSAYEASDFLWAKTDAVTSSAPNATLYFKHLLSSIRISLIEGDGFEDGEWASLEKSVFVNNTCRGASVDLSTGIVTPTGIKDGKSIVAKIDKNDFRAIVIPQIVNAGESLLTITVGTSTYKFVKDVVMTYNPSKQHNFTIEVTKKDSNGDFEFTLVDESITAWESDVTSHNGEAREYIVVDLQEAGTLESTIKNLKLEPAEIVNLKLSGLMESSDFKYIRDHMTSLEAVNIRDVEIKRPSDQEDPQYWVEKDDYLPNNALANITTLKYVVFPKKIKSIGERAFYHTSISGSLDIPEGVEKIGNEAFLNNFTQADVDVDYSFTPNNLTGTLTLPSSLKEIGNEAFGGCDFSGSLLIPDGVVKIGWGAFKNCKYFTGEIHIPESVEEIENFAFAEMDGIRGRINLPSKLKIIPAGIFQKTSISGIQWPESPNQIGDWAFCNNKNHIDLKIPESVLTLGEYCFANSAYSHVYLPPEITSIPDNCFENCLQLSDTLNIPQKVESIDGSAFYNCPNLEAVVLPKNLQRISNYAFAYCFGLNYIRCDAPEPPVLAEDAFMGVEKDNFTVEVPEGSVDAYRNAPGWCEFKRISAYRNFVARPSKYNVLNKGGKKEIVLNADADWEMTDCPSWCHIDKTSGSKKTVITLTVDAMAKGSSIRNGNVVFRLKGSNEYETHINVGQYDYEYDEDQYLTLQPAKAGNGINIVLLGDGYDAADIASGSYLSDMKQEMEYFFGVEPYTTYRDYFNVYTAFALSEDSGVESINSWRNTKFGVSLGDGCSKYGQRLFADCENALDYCAGKVPPTVSDPNPQVGCILIANTDVYEGVTYMGESFCAVVTKSTENYPYDARGLIQHEAGGHGFGWLGDEYIYTKAFITNCGCAEPHVKDLLANQATGYALNLSLAGKYKDVPWSHLIFNPSYGDIVDIYEGGYFHSRGVYRSEINSCMNNNVPYFSTWSRQLIVQRIMKLAGQEFSLDEFYKNDKRDMGRDFTSTSRSGAIDASSPVRHGNPPVFIKNYKFGKKGGKK